MKVVGLGAGGHARVVLDILRLRGEVTVVGLLDPIEELWGTELGGCPVLGNDELLVRLADEGIRAAFLGLGVVTDTRPRIALFERAREHEFELISAIHPRAILAESARIGPGATIMAGAIVNAQTVIGQNVILNTGSIVEHDCHIGDHVHLASGARLGGNVRVGEGAFIGIGTSVLPGARIGAQSVVGAGAVVVSDVPDYCVAVGMPARVIRTIDP